MFDVPFRYGHPWSAAEDEGHAPVIAITKALNDRMFGGASSVGKTLNLSGKTIRSWA